MSPSDRLWSLVALRRTNLKEDKWVKALWNDPIQLFDSKCCDGSLTGVLTDFTERSPSYFNLRNSSSNCLRLRWQLGILCAVTGCRCNGP